MRPSQIFMTRLLCEAERRRHTRATTAAEVDATS
jgi:hypothetical protein